MNLVLFIIIPLLSFSGMVFLLGLRFYSIRQLKKDQLIVGLVSRPSFFEEFHKPLILLTKLLNKTYLLLNQGFSRLALLFGELVSPVKLYWCRFSNYVHGRHSVEKNGCKGYWGEINNNKEEEQ